MATTTCSLDAPISVVDSFLSHRSTEFTKDSKEATFRCFQTRTIEYDRMDVVGWFRQNIPVACEFALKNVSIWAPVNVHKVGESIQVGMHTNRIYP